MQPQKHRLSMSSYLHLFLIKLIIHYCFINDFSLTDKADGHSFNKLAIVSPPDHFLEDEVWLRETIINNLNTMLDDWCQYLLFIAYTLNPYCLQTVEIRAALKVHVTIIQVLFSTPNNNFMTHRLYDTWSRNIKEKTNHIHYRNHLYHQFKIIHVYHFGFLTQWLLTRTSVNYWSFI